MSFTKAMQEAGYEPKASTSGDKTIYNGIYKFMMTEFKNEPNGKWDDGQPKPQVIAGFKVTDRLAGTDVYKSDYADVRGYYATDEKNAANRKRGIAKLIDGLISVGINVNGKTDDETIQNLTNQIGVAEVYMKLFPDWKNVKDDEGNWSKKKKDEDGIDIAPFQNHSFLTQKNAEKMAKSMQKKVEHHL